MSRRALAELAFGVSGVYLVASRTPEIGGVLLMLFFDSAPDASTRWAFIAHVGLIFATGAGLFAFRGTLARLIVPSDEVQSLNDGISELQAAAFSVLGAYLVAFSLSGIVSSLVSILAVRGSLDSPSSWIFGFTKEAVLLALGLILFLGARGIVGFWRRTRSAGRNRTHDDSG
jgi:Na+-driven multidrug efflux pump